MASYPLLNLTEGSFKFGQEILFAELNLSIASGDRIALVGRNGCGKSTLMRILAGLTDLESGLRYLKPGTIVRFLEQAPNLINFNTLKDYVYADLPVELYHLADHSTTKLDVNLSKSPKTSSGGELRRAALAKVLATEFDILLLDEPTNHLDIKTIEWLEAYLIRTKKAIVIISHDRKFLSNLTKKVFWIDRTVCRESSQGFHKFEKWRETIYAEDTEKRRKLESKIKLETRWALEGISARRKRNQGRLKKLTKLRLKQKKILTPSQNIKLEFKEELRSGKVVVQAENASIVINSKTLVTDFSLIINRGEKLAIVGENGSGKTSLLKLFLKQIEPANGKIKLGSSTNVAMFDQERESMSSNISLWDFLANNQTTQIHGTSDQIIVRGRPRHVLGYLKDFLFSESQAKTPISKLSGGEKARLLLASVMAKDSNLLILDEPTNDLDIETLDLLKELIAEYSGTVIFASHDRDFIDSVATGTLAIENRNLVRYAGGFSDYKTELIQLRKKKKVPTNFGLGKIAGKQIRQKNNFKKNNKSDYLLKEIDLVSREITKLETFLADPDLFNFNKDKFNKASEALAKRQNLLSNLEDEWLALEN